MEERVKGIEKDIKQIQNDVKELKNEDKDLRGALQNLKESIVELTTLLKAILSIGKWGFGIIASITAGVGIAVVIAIAQLLK